MRTVAAVMLWIALAMVSGCARLALMQSDDPLADLRKARAEQNYERALYIAEHLDSDHPDHDRVQDLLPELRGEIEDFEHKTIRRAERLAEQDQWERVWRVLAEAMEQWRPSSTLREARERLREREERRRRESTGELLLAETHWRLSSSDLAEQLTRYTDSASRRRHQHWQQRNRDLARRLVHHGRWFLERENWQRAHDYLDNAHALHEDAVPEDLLARAREKHAALAQRSRAQRKEQQREQARQQRERARTLLNQYLDSGKLEDLLALRQHVREHAGPHLPGELTARVEILSRQRFRAEMEKGDARYARGDYRQARETWRAIEPLAPPESELAKKLERVERVLEKLHKLKNNGN